MTLRYTLDPPLDRRLAAGVSELWAAAVNAGGTLGFVPPVTAQDTRVEVLKYFAVISEGRSRVLVGQDTRGEVKATAYFSFNTTDVMRHWVGLHTVMVHPRLQGQGVGRELMSAVERTARSFDGVRAIKLGCRGGLGLEYFYGACGYEEVGRVPEAIRVGEDEFRDDITMWLSLADLSGEG